METTSAFRLDISCGVPHRREKRFGNGVKNLSGSADIPKLLIIFIAEKERLTLNGVRLTELEEWR
jgi:hypothetical protein